MHYKVLHAVLQTLRGRQVSSDVYSAAVHKFDMMIGWALNNYTKKVKPAIQEDFGTSIFRSSEALKRPLRSSSKGRERERERERETLLGNWIPRKQSATNIVCQLLLVHGYRCYSPDLCSSPSGQTWSEIS